MIEVETPYEIQSIGHNGINFLAVSMFDTKMWSMSQFEIRIYKFNSKYQLKQMVQYTTGLSGWFSALMPDYNGQSFKSSSGLFIEVNKENKCRFLQFNNSSRQDYTLQSVINNSNTYETLNHVFCFPSKIENDIHKFFKIFFNLTIPEMSSSNLLKFNKSTKQIEIFEFKNGIVSVIVNPDESVLCVATKNKLFFMDI